MYPVALYGSLPEIAYLVPRGGFRVHGAVEEEPTLRSDRARSAAPGMNGAQRDPVAIPKSDHTN